MAVKFFLAIFLIGLASAGSASRIAVGPLVNTVTGFPGFNYIVSIVMENNGLSETYGQQCGGNCSYITQLADSYGLALNYSSVAHPSLPNYLSLTSAGNYSYFPFLTDCSPLQTGCSVPGFNIIDRIEGSGRTWRAYMEDYPTTGCRIVSNSGYYVNTHNPFLYYQDILNNTSRCQNIVRANPGSTGYLTMPLQLLNDLNSTAPANFMWLTPNLCNNGHDKCTPLNNTVSQSNQYLSLLVPKILNSALFRTQSSALFITWDEGTKCPRPGQTYPKCTDRVTSIWAGSLVGHGSRSNTAYSHYSFVKTVEYAWHLSTLTKFDSIAVPMNEFFIRTAGGSGRPPLRT
jgi:hypothetical protein